MRLYDSRLLAPDDRLDKLHDAYASNLWASRLEVPRDQAGGTLTTSLDYFPLGTCAVVQTSSSSFRLSRTPSLIARDPSALLSLPIVSGGELEYLGERRVVGSGDLSVIDSEQVQSFHQPQHGSGTLFQLPRDLLALPPDVILEGSRHLEHSPLYPVVRGYLHDLFRHIEPISQDPVAASAAEQSGIELVRALLVSAARPRDGLRDAFAETFVSSALAYARRHLSDPSLTLGQVAVRLNVSRRYGYARFAEAGISFEQWVIERRLHGARAAMMSPERSQVTIEAIAHTWGFRDASHFVRRFRQAFGCTPTQWRRRASGTSPGRDDDLLAP
ncbi:helix-turn-helix transcriptional regulator [Nocardioides humi]|uniref:HTH araC/xylS-type domain-containing protein n=1 Tax=Nocardioides humi TaxID=449461 RepID=A0ABN1ZV18_9ACTN|nr:AraC family transcriptional regulator [Nocardioides humi]